MTYRKQIRLTGGPHDGEDFSVDALREWFHVDWGNPPYSGHRTQAKYRRVGETSVYEFVDERSYDWNDDATQTD